MERGVYLTEFGGLTEINAVDQDGNLVRRLIVRTDLYRDRDLEEMRAFLDRLSPPVSLRLV